MTSDLDGYELVSACARLSVHSRGGRRAVHKPLLVLLALADIQSGGTGKFHFNQVAPRLTELIREFTNHPNSQPRPHYPFWYLRTDGFWEMDKEAELLAAKAAGGSAEPPISAFRSLDPIGGVKDDMAERLRVHPNLIAEFARQILNATFPETRQKDVLESIGLSTVEPQTKVRRDASFRRDVLREYNYRCAVCGFDGRVGSIPVGVEAAHIRMLAFNGENNVSNGVALCSLHHKLFDAGAFTISDEFDVLVSSSLTGGSDLVSDFVRQHRRIHLPLRAEYKPAVKNLAWHRRELFVDR